MNNGNLYVKNKKMLKKYFRAVIIIHNYYTSKLTIFPVSPQHHYDILNLCV